MIKKINQYLLTHKPLLWNTRIIWILTINFILHLLFFISGLVSITATQIIDQSSLRSVGGASLYTFSVLCSLLVIIIWLIYFLKNNAFKSFYRINKWYLLKEFVLIFVILFTTITYFESYNYGVKQRAKSITNVAGFEREVNTVNHAMAYIPTNRDVYFILNNCTEKQKNQRSHSYNVPVDTAILIHSDIRTLEALRRPDAFSYKNYCELMFPSFSYDKIDSAEKFNNINNKWIEKHQADSIRQLLQSFIGICQKYDISQNLNIDSLSNSVFATPYYNVSPLIPTQEFYTDNYGVAHHNKYFIETYDLNRVYDFLYECLPNQSSNEEQRNILTTLGYTALSLAILLLCYRRFSRKVFLISLVGTIVWAILIGLFMAASSDTETSFAVLCLLLCLVFWIIAWINFRSKALKTATGALFNWHLYLTPFFTMFILMIIDDYYGDKKILLSGRNISDVEAYMQKTYPVLYWINSHSADIILVNLFVTTTYVAIAFNKWAKQWHVMPEE